MNPKPVRFDHEKPNVCHCSLKFIKWVTELFQRVSTRLSVHGQLDRASSLIPLIIAESKIKNCAVVLGILLELPLWAQDWPRWGGPAPGRNMYSAAKGLPDRFDPGKPKPGTDGID